MTDRLARRQVLFEATKLAARRRLYRHRLDISLDPLPVRLARMMAWLDIRTVLDIGANVGQFGTALRASGYTGRIVSVEPVADAYAQLETRASRDKRWQAIRSAVGAEPGELDMHVSQNSFSSSLLRPSAKLLSVEPAVKEVRLERVPVTTVVRLVDALRLDVSSTLLKVDTQGYEEHVLDGAGELIGQFPAVLLEMSQAVLYDGQCTAESITRRMTSAGMAMFGLDAGLADPVTGQTLQWDCIFVPSARFPSP